MEEDTEEVVNRETIQRTQQLQEAIDEELENISSGEI